jgi:DNA invertase Pin-like site-specific DNA recombinase
MARASIYARVSGDDQAASGLGVDAQIHACRAWAVREGRGVVGPFVDDGVGGATGLDRRPALLEAVAQLEPGDVLLVAKRDRLGREPMVIAMIEAAVARKKCRIISAAGEGTESDDPSAVLMRRMVDAFAEYERLIIKARTRAALSAKRRRGERTGQVPFGSSLAADGKTLVPAEGELRALEDMRRWRAAGCTLRAIADRLTALGIRPKNGAGRWCHASVRHLLNTREATHAEERREIGPKGPEGGPSRPEHEAA